MPRRRGFDDFDELGQVDGDAAPPANFVPFQAPGAGQPWLRSPVPPWHLWGNSQTARLEGGGFLATQFTSTSQILKVSYRRPETFHWLFFAKLIKVDPIPSGIQQAGIQIDFDVIVGIGRSNIIIPSFERYFWRWNDTFAGGNLPAAPDFNKRYSSTVQAPLRVFDITVPAGQQPNVISELVAEDIQVQVRATDVGNYVYTLDYEVGAQFAPKNHLRPDWFLDAPAEQVFAGSETEGR